MIVQTDAGNRSTRYTNTIVVAVSTASHAVPFHVSIDPSEANGLTRRCYVLCEQLMTISKERLDGYIGDVEEELMVRVDAALKRVLALR